MSRGLGVVQRFVLEELAENYAGPPPGWASVVTLAQVRHQHGCNDDPCTHRPTAAELESMRRAVRSLHNGGHIEAQYARITVPASYRACWEMRPYYPNGRAEGRWERWGLHARLPLSPEEQATEAEEKARNAARRAEELKLLIAYAHS